MNCFYYVWIICNFNGGGGGHIILKGTGVPRISCPRGTLSPRITCPGDSWSQG